MKKFLTSVAMVLLLAGCAQKYDDSAITARLSAIETKLIELEGNIMALQSAIGEGVFVAKVQEHVDAESGKTDGVTITYTNGDVKWFKIETNVADVNAPVLGVITSGSGDLVWAVNGTAIVIDGKEVPVYQTPVFTLDDDGFLWVEVNGKKAKLGQVQNEGATLVDGIFTDIKVEQDKIVLTLSDGTKVNVPFAEAFQLVLEKTEFVYAVLGPIDVFYEVNAATANTVVGVAGYNPKEFSVELKPENKKVVITPLKEKASGVFLVYADSKIGLTSLVSIVVEAEGVEVVDEPFSDEVDYMADGELGLVTANVVANVPFEVKPVEDWIHVVAVKSKVSTISLSLDDNNTGVIRVGTVNIVKEGTDDIIQSFKIGQDIIPEGPKNLSSKGAANSYIVTAAGDYMFAAVKGNTVESVGAVASVEILWETENTATAPNVNDIIAKVSYADGYISFSTPETLKPGNAVIAAKNGETILWSWHIWIPKTDVTVQDAVAFSGANMMDRNLGALVTTAATGDVDPLSIGLYYQWGRKDPFPGHHSFGKDEGAKVAGISMTKHGEAADMAYAIAHPTEYIHQKGVWDCWWNSEEPTDSWNSSDNKKTIYDPCPPGYRVPIRDGEKPMWSTSSTGWTFTTAEHRIKYGDFVFPTCGYIDCDGGSYYKSDIRCFVWSATHRDQKRSYTLLFNTSNIDDSSNHKAKAGNVRCVVE